MWTVHIWLVSELIFMTLNVSRTTWHIPPPPAHLSSSYLGLTGLIWGLLWGHTAGIPQLFLEFSSSQCRRWHKTCGNDHAGHLGHRHRGCGRVAPPLCDLLLYPWPSPHTAPVQALRVPETSMSNTYTVWLKQTVEINGKYLNVYIWELK